MVLDYETLDSHWYHYRNCTDSSSRSASKKEAKIMGLFQFFKTENKYQHCSQEIDDLLEALSASVKDGKISNKIDRSRCMKKYWKLVKSIEVN